MMGQAHDVNPTREAREGASFIELNAWDDLRPWSDYRGPEVFVTETLNLPAPAEARRLTPSLRIYPQP